MFKSQNKAMSHDKAKQKTEIIIDSIKGATMEETVQRQKDTQLLSEMVGKLLQGSMK